MGLLATCCRHGARASNVVAVCLLASQSGCRTDTPPVRAREPVVRIGTTVSPSGGGGDIGVGQLSWLITGEGLTRTSRDGRWQPNLAESWTESADGLTVTIALRKGLRFSNGSALTADEVAASLENSRQAARYLFQYPTLRDIASIEAADSHTIVLRLHRRSALLASDFSVPILKGTDEHAPTTGAYLPAPTSDGKTQFVANPYYHAGAATIARVEQHNYTSLRQAWTSLMRGEIDFLLDVPHEVRSFVERESTVQVFSSRRPYVFTLAFNTRSGVLREPAIRIALNYAVDRQGIVEQVLHGHGVVAHGPIWVGHYAASTGLESRYRYEPARADAILNRAGIPRTLLAGGGDGMHGRLRFNCVVPRSQIHEHVALLLQKQFFVVGIDMRISVVSPGDLVANVTNGTYDAVLLDLAGGPTLLRAYQFWHSSGAGSAFRFGNGEADAELDMLYSAPDEKVLRDAVVRVQGRMDANPPAVFLFWPDVGRAVSKRFTVPRSDQDILTTMWRWQLAP
jgi:ABC-type transport system substrate-binding protein